VTRPTLDHVSVTVSDLDRSIAFYRDVVGLELRGTGSSDEPELSDVLSVDDVEIEWAELSLGPVILELVHYVSNGGDPTDVDVKRPGATHIGIAVEDIVEPTARLREAGALVSRNVVTLTEDSDWNGAKIVYARDPDGVTIELVERARRVVVVPDAEATTDRT
jgi:catechol 2,3-dioxygenase-like lactoylglutathione lyase family enzyme